MSRRWRWPAAQTAWISCAGSSREARNWLTDDGVLVVEIGNERANVEAAFGGLDLVWLSTSAGDDNVFLIQAADLPS